MAVNVNMVYWLILAVLESRAETGPHAHSVQSAPINSWEMFYLSTPQSLIILASINKSQFSVHCISVLFCLEVVHILLMQLRCCWSDHLRRKKKKQTLTINYFQIQQNENFAENFCSFINTRSIKCFF